MFYKPKHFVLQELISPEIHYKYGSKALEFLDPKALLSLDCIWEMVNESRRRRVWCNNWLWGGDRLWSGYRPPSCHVGADNSSHRRGTAYDIVVEGMAAEEVRSRILHYQDIYYELRFVTRLENKKNNLPIPWVHFDCANYDKTQEYMYEGQAMTGILLFDV